MFTEMHLVHTGKMDIAVSVSTERVVRQRHQQLADIILTMC